MTSPIRDYSFVQGEKLSPIKLTEATFEAHPHGLTAKNEARRNTIHLTQNRTPLAKKIGTPSSSLKPLVGSFTSPRAFKTIQRLEAIKANNKQADKHRYMSETESSPTNKENIYRKLEKPRRISNEVNTNSFDSSPLKIDSPSKNTSKKRYLQTKNEGDDKHKIAKIITNANDSSFVEEKVANTSIPIDEVFNKEDIVERVSNKPIAAVIDNDSDDSDLEVRNSVDEFSQTMQTKKLSNREHNNTQINNVISNQDYITPQRPTEAIAKSPKTSQSARISENVEVHEKSVSPLKSHEKTTIVEVKDDHDYDQDDIDGDIDNDADLNSLDLEEVEPTINFLMSPNSKPVFSLDHIKKIQNENAAELENLENIIFEKNQEILKFSEELSSTNGKFLILDQEIKELSSAKKKLIANEELLKVQLKHTERELAKSTKTLKLKQNYISQIESRNTKYRNQIKSNNENISILQNEKENLQNSIKELQRKVNIEEKKNEESARSIFELKEEIALQLKDLNLLKQSNISQNLKLESLAKDKNELLNELEAVRRENRELQEINDKQSSLVDELDKLETLAKDKIASLESTIKRHSDTIENLNSEKYDLEFQAQQISKNMSKLEGELKEKNQLIETANKSLEESEKERNEILNRFNDLKYKSDNSQTSVNELNDKIKQLNEEIDTMKIESARTMESLEKLKTANKEKDAIISGDTKQLSELTQKIESQKQIIADYEKKLEADKGAFLDNDEEVEMLKAEIKVLREEQELANEKNQARIQEVAESLYYQYSKKHELKVNEVRKSIEKKFRKQIDHLELRTKSQNRDIESLEKKLEIVNSEKNQLLSLVEEYKSIEEKECERERESRRRSPKKTSKRY